MMQGFHPFERTTTVFQKTVAINDFYLQGPDDARIRSARSSRRGARTASWRRPSYRGFRCWAYEAWVARGVDWLAISEDLPREDNRVTVDADGRIRLHYRPNNLAAA